MASCQCEAIRQMNNRIDLLEKEDQKINFYYASIPKQFNALREDLDSLAVACEGAFQSDRMNDLTTRIRDTDNMMIEARNEISAAITKRLGELRDELKDLKEEDQAYHDEQKRLEEENAAEAAEAAEEEDDN